MKRKIITSSIILISLYLNGCSLFSPPSNSASESTEQIKLFKASFDDVWRATQITLSSYPVRINNMDIGIIETDVVKGNNIWNSPGTRRNKSGVQYFIRIQVVQGKSKSQSAIKVIVEKDIKRNKNFFSDSAQINSDGLEEKVILYRIGREIRLERERKRVMKSSN